MALFKAKIRGRYRRGGSCTSTPKNPCRVCEGLSKPTSLIAFFILVNDGPSWEAIYP